jgi:uncharacterized membrane protein
MRTMSPSRALRHWLLAVNVATGVFLGGALAAPLLAAVGWQAAADALYAAYHLTCHQWAFRTFFVFGQQPVYTEQGLADLGTDPFRFVGDQDLGWKIAICERDLAIYAGLLVVGLVYARQRNLQASAPIARAPGSDNPPLPAHNVGPNTAQHNGHVAGLDSPQRNVQIAGTNSPQRNAQIVGPSNPQHHGHQVVGLDTPQPPDQITAPRGPHTPVQIARPSTLSPLGFKTYGVLILPMALDGFTQLFGWRESTWELRVMTGLIFGLASGWLVLPRLDTAFGLRPAAARYAPDAVCERLSPASRRG